ncbi:MAG TPA: hypothetical protein PKA99_13645 [Dermatophilaceae bacterium]|nr:hypothetical protein [Dermatophilaceae bacterium]
MTGPYHPSVATLVTGPHRQTVSAAFMDALGTVPLNLLHGSTVDWSERRSPCVATNLVCDIPAPDVLARLDPRKNVRVTITAGYHLADGSRSVAEVANLHLRARTVDRPRQTLTLTAVSDEALVIEGSKRATPIETPYIPWHVSFGIGTLITEVLAGGPAASPLIVDTAPRVTGQTVIGTDYWRAITDLADIADVDVYDEGDRVFRIAPRVYVASESVAVIRTGPGGTVTASAAVVDRDDFANDVQLAYEWKDAANVQQRVIGRATTSGVWAPVGVGFCGHVENREGPITQGGADAAAATLLRRLMSRSRTIEVESVAHWWIRPRQTITLQLPTGEQSRVIVVSARFDLTSRTMHLVTRAPETALSLTGE